MKVLFLHQNCPGQFKHLAPALSDRGDEVAFISQPGRPTPKGSRKIEYEPHRAVTEKIHNYLRSTEAAVLNGQAVARICFKLKDDGYRPDVVIGNPGWGETLFLKEIWPEVPILSMVEFFYRSRGSDVGFDPEFPSTNDTLLRARTRSSFHLTAIEATDAAYAPTHWQKSQFPAVFHDKIRVIHDGIDCDAVRPAEHSKFVLPDGSTLTKNDEVLTYVARNLEPYRGFHSFMRALPSILESRPDAKVVIVGGDDVSYGSKPGGEKTWRQVMLDEVGPLPDRVHFVGSLPYDQYLSLIQISSVHAYFTYPFVLSWSMLEVMAAGGVVVGSDTPPVAEVIEEAKNGYLVGFFDVHAIATKISWALENRGDLNSVRQAARKTVLERFNLKDCLGAQIELIDELASRSR
ncbi:MAG: glycosyltransferase family 4 protein [Boseongicola sp.]|nr:glycosyltransferase family 4 protein [Boseongicola sp.]